MLLHWLAVVFVLVALSYALWRLTRRKLETRRNGKLMKHLDWTRSARSSRGAARKRGFLASVLGH